MRHQECASPSLAGQVALEGASQLLQPIHSLGTKKMPGSGVLPIPWPSSWVWRQPKIEKDPEPRSVGLAWEEPVQCLRRPQPGCLNLGGTVQRGATAAQPTWRAPAQSLRCSGMGDSRQLTWPSFTRAVTLPFRLTEAAPPRAGGSRGSRGSSP